MIILKAAEDTIIDVLTRNHYDKNVFDIDSYFAGSYEEMAQISDFLYASGYDFIYDPRKLDLHVENLGNYFFYRITNPDGHVITAGFEPADYPDSTDDELRFHLRNNWTNINKARPTSKFQEMMQQYMAVPRTVIISNDEVEKLDLSEDDFCGCAEETFEGLEISADFMTVFALNPRDTLSE